MGETVRWAQNCLRIFKLSKSLNGKESIPAQSTCHMASATEGEGGKKASTSGPGPGSLWAQTEMASSQPLFANPSEHRKQDCTKVCQAVSQSESINLDRESRKRGMPKRMGEQSMQHALRMLTEVNYY